MTSRNELDYILRNITQIPTLPIIYYSLEELIRKPNTSAMEVGSFIERDQALTTRVLRVINSAFYGLPNTITTVSRAVTMLGFNGVKNTVLSTAILNLFEHQFGLQSLFDYTGFWRHSLAVAVCSRIIALNTGPLVVKDPEEAFTAGLIHDIGKIIEDQFVHTTMTRALEACKQERLWIADAEQRLFGFNHMDIGGALAGRWNLPSTLRHCIRFHNCPQRETKDMVLFPLVSVVHMADLFVRAMDIGWAGDTLVPVCFQDSWTCLKLNNGLIQTIWNQTEKAYDEMVVMLFHERKA